MIFRERKIGLGEQVVHALERTSRVLLAPIGISRMTDGIEQNRQFGHSVRQTAKDAVTDLALGLFMPVTTNSDFKQQQWTWLVDAFSLMPPAIIGTVEYAITNDVAGAFRDAFILKYFTSSLLVGGQEIARAGEQLFRRLAVPRV